MEEYTIDAREKKIGRVASDAANVLIGKNSVSYKPNVAPDVSVTIINADKISIPVSKLKNKTYVRYSGYPGGLKKEPLEKIIEKKGVEEVLRIAIKGMLPANKLRNKMLKNVKISK